MLKIDLKIGNLIEIRETNNKQLRVTYKSFVMPVREIHFIYIDGTPKTISAKFIFNKREILTSIEDSSLNYDFFQEFVSELSRNSFSIIYED
jgi:hypothetical protein